jgi:hypothetical protein
MGEFLRPSSSQYVKFKTAELDLGFRCDVVEAFALLKIMKVCEALTA